MSIKNIQNDSIAILFVSNPCNDMHIKTNSNDTSNDNNNSNDRKEPIVSKKRQYYH